MHACTQHAHTHALAGTHTYSIYGSVKITTYHVTSSPSLKKPFSTNAHIPTYIHSHTHERMHANKHAYTNTYTYTLVLWTTPSVHSIWTDF